MIKFFKERIARYLLKKNAKKVWHDRQSFSGWFKKSFSFLVIMPEEEDDFKHAIQVLNFLKDEKKKIIIFTHDYRISLLPASLRSCAIEHGIDDLNKLDFPSRRIIEKLNQHEFQSIIDLNRNENIFYLAVIVSFDCPVKIGFSKTQVDRFYNIQVKIDEKSAELSYRNLLNCLKMF
jgi:hypothetical protein